MKIWSVKLKYLVHQCLVCLSIIRQMSSEDPENSVRGSPQNFFSHQSISQRAVLTSFENKFDGPNGSNWFWRTGWFIV